MRVLIAPDCFGGTLTAAQAATAIGEGWLGARAGDEVDLAPLSDGGPGFLDTLAGALAGACFEEVAASDPLGRSVRAAVLRHGDTVFVEAAQACGLHLLATGERDPEAASSAGVADLLGAAARGATRRVVVGLGGTGVSDGGEGMLAALDPQVRTRLGGFELLAATDVDNPLLGPAGAVAMFGAQKGASAAAKVRLEQRLAAVVAGTADGVALACRPGAGAGGGLGFALFQLGARRISGARFTADTVGLTERIGRAAVVVTGEGRLDETSLRGKVVGAVALAGQAAGRPVLAVAGSVALSPERLRAAGVARAWSLAERAGSAQAAMERAGYWLTRTAEAAAHEADCYAP